MSYLTYFITETNSWMIEIIIDDIRQPFHAIPIILVLWR